jgi:two-component system KDP operon response regulator KdpE
MRVAVRHALAIGGPAEPVFEAGGLRVDIAQRRVFRNQEEVHLTPNEHRLLQVLVRHAGKVLTHRQLLKEAWGAGATDQIHNLRVYMNQLRQKLEEDPTRPRLLVTELGVGYRLKPD